MKDLLDRPSFPKSFYAADPLVVARQLLGGLIVHNSQDHGVLAGRIVETEAYRGEEDLACHASAGRTARTEVLYGAPGFAYVYLIYGMYCMLNAVVWAEGQPGGVLIRGLEPVFGVDRSTDGPGKLSKALMVDMRLNRADLAGPRLTFAPDRTIADDAIEATRRIGVDYAGEWAEKLWRFSIVGNPFVSRWQRRSR